MAAPLIPVAVAALGYAATATEWGARRYAPERKDVPKLLLGGLIGYGIATVAFTALARQQVEEQTGLSGAAATAVVLPGTAALGVLGAVVGAALAARS